MNKSVIEIERKKKSKYGINALKDTLNEFYKGIGYSKTAQYIKDNNYIEFINFVIDNYNIQELLDEEPLRALAYIELMYMQKYMPIDKKIFDFLFRYPNESSNVEFEKLLEYLSLNSFANCENIELYITRFQKLKLIELNEQDKDKIAFEYKQNKDKYMESILNHSKSKHEKIIQRNADIKTKTYMTIIEEAYKLYCNGYSFDQLCELPIGDPSTFYKHIDNIKNQIIDELQDFAINYAKYAYNKSLRKKYSIDLFLTEYENETSLCEKIYNFFDCNTATKICHRIDAFINLSPLITNKEIRTLKHIKQIYCEFYDKKKLEIEEKRKQEQLNKKVNFAIDVVKSFIDYNKSVYDFCNESEFSKKELLKAASVLKNNNHVLYDQFVEQCSQMESEKEKSAVKLAKHISNLIMNGVKFEEKSRNFDILDYYSITDLTFSEMLEFIKDKIDKSDYIVVANFMRSNTVEFNWGEFNINTVLNGEHIINANSNGKNNGEKVPMEIKQKAIKTLKQLNIPINGVTYNAILTRILIGEDVDNLTILGNKEKISNEKILSLR